jgi:hypothetical protein
MKPGINVTEPMTEANITPINPDLSPIKYEIVSGLKRDKEIPMIIKIARSWGRIFSKDFQAFFKAIIVFCRSRKNDSISREPARKLRIIKHSLFLLSRAPYSSIFYLCVWNASGNNYSDWLVKFTPFR